MLVTIEYDANGRDASGYKCCPVCNCPHKRDACENPACDANPDIPESVKAARRDAAAKRAEQDAKWAADRQLRARAWESTRRAESYAGGARDIQKIAVDVKARQTAFLDERGMAWDQARALPQEAKDALQAEWLAWDKANPAA